jgi:parvulin-like peptidyl-prolyl isomerase
MAIEKNNIRVFRKYSVRRVSVELYFMRVFFFPLLFALLAGCASTSNKDEVVALVEGSPIYTDEIMYSASIAHRKEDLPKTKELDFSDYIQKAIGEKLITEEARRMGMDEFPEVREKVRGFVLRESVVMLHNEEIASKITVSDEEILNAYRENYVKYDYIEFQNQEDANAALEQLKNGADFREVSLKYTAPETHNSNIDIVRLKKSLRPEYKEALSAIKPGEHTEIISAGDKYLIIKLLNPSAEDKIFQDRTRKEIEKAIRKQKELGTDYLKALREKAPVKIEEELLAGLNSDIEKGDREKWTGDKRPVASVYESVLTVEELLKMSGPRGNSEGPLRRPLIDSVNSWIDYKLVDHEALSRHYELKPELEAKVYNYTNQLIKDVFIRNVILPNIVFTEEKLIDHYNRNLADYMLPAKYKVQMMSLDTREEAESASNSLKAGADFAWLTNTKTGREISDILWTQEQLPETLAENIESMEPGDISPVFEYDNKFSIIQMKEKTKAMPNKFENVIEQVKKSYFLNKMEELLNEYKEKLRVGAEIIIYEDVVKKMQETFSK